MYKEFYHFKENPFNVTSDPVFFFSSNCHSQAFSHLSYGIEHRKGILLITGEVGTGKTTLCRTLLDKYRNHKEYNVKTALILNPSFSDQQLLQLILKDFGIQEILENKFDLVNALNKFLLDETGKGNNIVLLIDEAQNLGVDQLEQIRLLSNLETEKEKLLQIILIGQPELCAKLELASLRQLNQRIAVRYHLRPLQREEIKRYINHRLKIVLSKNSDNSVRFTNKAIDVIYESCKGTPRLINIICDRALLAGYTQETFIIDFEIISMCVKEVGINIIAEPNRIQRPQKNFEPEELIVGSTKKRSVWYKNIYILIFVFFAVVGSLYTAFDYFDLTTSQKPSDRNLPVRSSATNRFRLHEPKRVELPVVLDKPDLPVRENVAQSEAQNKPNVQEQKSDMPPTSDKSGLPEPKHVEPSVVLDKPDLPVRENVAQSEAQNKPSVPEQKSDVPPETSDTSGLPKQKLLESSVVLDKPDLPVRENVAQSEAQNKHSVPEQKSDVLPETSDTSGLPEQKLVESSVVLDKPDLQVKESVAQSDVQDKLRVSEQKSKVLTNVSDKSTLPIQKKNVKKGFRLLKPASRHVETVPEQYTKGLKFYEQGHYKKAAVWFRKAAEQGHAKAQSNLGVMYSDGQGVKRDYNEAVKWCRKAAEQGYAQAQTNLCIMYSKGKGVEQDYNKMSKWCHKAAEQGNGQAQAILGIMYSEGQGVEQNAEEAVKWFEKASKQGVDYAKKAMGRLELDYE